MASSTRKIRLYYSQGFVLVGVSFAQAMTEHRIAILPGDGTGREVAQEAVRLLETISEHSKHGFELTQIDCGGQHFKEVGVEWAEGSFDFCKNEADAIFWERLGTLAHICQTAILPAAQ